jgi:hypothetical protein
MMKAGLPLTALLAFCACASPDASPDAAARDSVNAAAPAAASVPHTIIPDGFTEVDGVQQFAARKAFDLTGDGRPETVVVDAAGPRIDTARIVLAVLAANGDMLYKDSWNANDYFMYEYRSTMSDSAANAKVLTHLKQLLSDDRFTSDGPSVQLGKSIPGGIDRDAVRYDLKEEAVRARHRVPRGVALTPPMYAELEKAPAPESTIDSLITELKTRPTFTYYGGGEVTSTVAWSASRGRFVRIFSCC